jgi:hypothetical protein
MGTRAEYYLSIGYNLPYKRAYHDHGSTRVEYLIWNVMNMQGVSTCNKRRRAKHPKSLHEPSRRGKCSLISRNPAPDYWNRNALDRKSLE